MTLLKKEEISTIVLVSDSSKLPIMLRHKLPEQHLVITSAKKFDESSIKFMKADLVILDDTKLKKRIFSLCQSLRHLRGYEKVPILVISSDLKRSYAKELLKAGAFDLLREPFEDEELFLRLELAKRYRNTHLKIDSIAKEVAVSAEETETKKRVFFDKQLLRKIQDRAKGSSRLSLGMLEVDQYIQTLQKYKDDITNEAMYLLSSSIRGLIRTDDFVLHLGSGKFLLVFFDTGEEMAMALCDELREEVSSLEFDIQKAKLMFTISIGLASQRGKIELDQLSAIAKMSLESAKEKKNCVIHTK